MRIRSPFLAGAAALALTACTHVELTPEAEAVALRQPGETAGCQKVGTASASTKQRVWMFGRNEDTIQNELNSLARNEAAKLGGNAIVANSAVEEGRQTYDVYKCGG